MGTSESKPDANEIDSSWDDDDDVDSGWEDEDAIDSGWDEGLATETDGGKGPPRVLTAKEREARAVRDAARKDRQRAKAAEKKERRKSRAASASAKQKKQAKPEKKAPAPRTKAPTFRVEERPRVAESAESEAPARDSRRIETAGKIPRRVPLAVIVVLVLVAAAGAIGLYLARRLIDQRHSVPVRRSAG